MSDSLQPHELYIARLLCPWRLWGQEYWGGLPFPSPGDLPEPGIEAESLESPTLGGRFFTTELLGKLHISDTI